MATVHELNFGNYESLGTTAPVPRIRFDVNVKWTDDLGQMQEWSGSEVWPNVLTNAPNGWLRRKVLDEIITPLLMAYLGIQPLEE